MSEATESEPNGEAKAPYRVMDDRAQGLEQLKQAARELAEKKKLLNATNTKRAVSLEGFVEDALSPQLKAWLDDHLATLVEEIVRKEVRRIASECGL